MRTCIQRTRVNLLFMSINQSINQSIKQPINQSISTSIHSATRPKDQTKQSASVYTSRLVIARLLTPRKPWRPLTYHGEIFRPPKYISVCCLCSEVVSLLWLRITKACTMHVMFSLSKHSPLFQCQRASSSLADVSIYMTIAKNHEGGRVFPTATWHPLILLGAGRRVGGGYS